MVAVSALLSNFLPGLVPGAAAAPPPGADQDVQDIWNGLDAFQSFTQGLATDGSLGQSLPDVSLVPGGPSALGFADLFQKTFIARLSPSAQHLSDLVNELNTTTPVSLESGGRSASVAVTSSTNSTTGIESLAFTVDVSRTVTGSPLSISSQSPQFAFDAPVTVDLGFHGAFTISYDPSVREVYIDTAAQNPVLTVTADAHFPCSGGSGSSCTQDASGVHAGVGILGVSLASGSSFLLTSSLSATLHDPNGDGRVSLGTFSGGTFDAFAEPDGQGGVKHGELWGGAAAAPGIVTVGFGSPAGALNATLDLVPDTSSLPAGLSSALSGASVGVSVSWPDISTGSPAVSVTSGGLAPLQAFENLSPRDLAQGLASLVTALESVQMSRTYTPQAGGKTGTLSSAVADGDSVAMYTPGTGGAPATGDIFQIGSAGQADEVAKVENASAPYKLTFDSPVNGGAATGSTLTQVDAHGNIDLPFMKGTLADLFSANEALVDFVHSHVTQTYNPLPNPKTGTLSGITGAQATYTVVSGGAPASGDYFKIGTGDFRVASVSGSGPYTVIFGSNLGGDTSAVQEQLGDAVPDFTSLQALIGELNTETTAAGAKITISNLAFDSASSKVSFTLALTRAQSSPINLDPFSVADSGTAATGTDSGPGGTGNPTLTDGTKKWGSDQFAGRVVKVGSATGVVKHNTATVLVLSGPWVGGTPSGNVAYQIGTQDPQTGEVSFANSLNSLASGGTGILNANASVPVATVNPSYTAQVTLVLDLETPKTGGQCTGQTYNGTAVTACPFSTTNPDGTTTIIDQLPTTADRIMIRTADGSGTPLHLITADAPIHTAVDVNATVGFLGIHLGGTLDVCADVSGGACVDPSTATDHLLSVDFASGLGDAQHDIPLSQVFSTLAHAPTSLISASVHGALVGTVTADVPGFSDLLGGTTPSFKVSWTDITDPGTITFDTSGFTDALNKVKSFNFDPSNPKALFTEILQTLKLLSTALKSAGSSTNPLVQQVLSTKIPVVGVKLGDVLSSSESGQGPGVSYTSTAITDTNQSFSGDLQYRRVVIGTSAAVVTSVPDPHTLDIQWLGTPPSPLPAIGTQYTVENALDSAIDLLTASPSDNLQALVNTVNTQLGAASIPIVVSVDTSGATPVLGLALDWHRDFRYQTPIAFNFNVGSQAASIVGTQASGLVQLHAQAEIKAKLLLNLDPSAEAGNVLQVDPQKTSISANLGADVSGNVQANLGPLSLSLGEPDASKLATGVPHGSTDPTYPAEAHAIFSVGLSAPASDTSPQSIGDFLSSVASSGIQFNQGATPVTCSGDTTANMALCGALPVYLSTDGGQTYSPVNATNKNSDPPDTLRLRLPLSGDLSDEFALTDSSGNALPMSTTDSTPRFELPSSLGTDLANAVLDFSQLGNGIDGYFKFAEQTMNLASFGGKLPLVGQDLQQGAQFLQQAQATVDNVLGSLAGANSEQAFTDWVSNKLQSALNSAHILPSGTIPTPQFVCSANLATPTGVSATPTTSGSNTYDYVVSATNPLGETVASSPAATASSATLSSTNKVTVTWSSVDTAGGYKVYRSSDGGSTWQEFDVATSSSPQFVDTGASGTAASPKTSGTNPQEDPCPLTDVQGVTISADIGQGNPSADQGCTASDCLTASVPLSIGVPGLSISASTNADGTPNASQDLAVKLGWRIHLKIGLTRTQGFFIETQDQSAPELQLGLAITLPQSITANIAFVNVQLCNAAADEGTTCPFHPLRPNGTPDPTGAELPLFAGEIGIDLHTASDPSAFSTTITPNDDPSHNITLSDLANVSNLKNLITVGISAKVHIDWDFLAQLGTGSSPLSAFPGLGGEFKLDWSWGATTGGSTTYTAASGSGDDATPPSSGLVAPTISFDNVYITAGGFLSGVLKPILKEVQSITSPLKPVIDTLYAPIPVLSDLSHLAGGGDVTLITIAEAFSTLAGGPDLTMVQRILEVIKLVNSLPSGDQTTGIFIGSFHVSNSAVSTPATPDDSSSLIDSNPADGYKASSSSDVTSQMDSAASGGVSDSNTKAGFSFPIFDHPSSIFNLLMGGDIDLIRFDSGNITLGFSYSQQFGPVYAPPPVLITISGSASVTARIIAGFDTYGLRKAFEQIKAGQSAGTVTMSILNSLFLYTVDPTKNDGKPVAVLSLQGELAAGAEVSVLIVSVGVEGGISLTVNFYWNDPDNDGKFRLSEFLAAAFNNPICLFNVSGDLSVFLKVFVTIGIGPFSTTFDFTLVNIKLLDFSFHPNCAPPPPELGEVQGNTLFLFFGALGKDAQRGSPWGNDDGSPSTPPDEKVTVHELHDPSNGSFTGFGVDGLGRHEEFLNSGLTTVVFDAQGYGGNETVLITGDSNQTQKVSAGPPPVTPFDKTAIIVGGSGNDNIRVDGGTAYVDGGGGDDLIKVADGNDYVAGGPGNDSIAVGNGNDTVAGDSSLPVTSTVTLQDHRQVDSSNKPQGSWSDVANVPTGLGAPTAGESSTDGNDTILVGYGQDTVYGNGGDDSISVATDKILTGTETRQPGVNAASNDTIVGGTGNNNIHGGSGDDLIYPGQQWSDACNDPGFTDAPNYGGVGGDGTNTVDTGAGNDTVCGGSGADFVTGHSVSGGWDHFYGAGGNDVLVGGDGADHLYGGPGDDYLSGGPAKVDQLTPADAVLGGFRITPQPDGQPVDSKLLVGGDGNDHIYGGSGGDDIYGDRQEDHCQLPTSGPRSTPPPETNSGSPGNDYIVALAGNNTVSGGAGADTIYAGSGNDILCGGAGNDTIYGGPGNDNVFGGSGDDLLVGGSGNSSLYGNSGNDTIDGGSGQDWIEGNDGADTINGGTGSSVIIGGTSAAGQNDEGDVINGGPGNDIIIGDNGTVDANPVWPASGAPYATPVVVHSYDLDANAPGSTTYGGADHIWGGTGNDQIYGGLGDDYIVGGTGNDHIEGGPGSDTIYGGTGNDDILGGTSPQAVAGASVDGIPDGSDGHGLDVTPATLTSYSPVIGNTIYGYLPYGPNPPHSNVIVGGNGSVTETGVTNPNDGTPVRSVRQLALLSIGGNDTIYGGPGDDQIFGGLGDDTIRTGNADNYVEGGPGSDTIYGGTGANDIIGGTSPLTLPTSGADALVTAQVPDGSDTIYADGRTSPPPAGAPADGSDVVLADNGCISRGTAGAPTDVNGCPTDASSSPPVWQYSSADPGSVSPQYPNGNLVRPVIVQLDVTDCPTSTSCTYDVQGAADTVYGGTGDDLLFGETGNDSLFGGPPGTNGLNGTAGLFVGNDYMEGGAGSDTMAGGAGDDDMIGGSAPQYLPHGVTTAMISDGTPGGSGFALAEPANPLLAIPGSGTVGNTMDGGAGNDVMLGGNGSITHPLDVSGHWARNQNDGAFIRTPINLDSQTIGGDDTMRGGPGDDMMFGALGNDYMDGGTGADYMEGGSGRDLMQGGGGDDDMVGGTSPIALPPPPQGQTNDQVAANTPDGTADPAHPGQTLGNIICGYYCGQSLTPTSDPGNSSDDDAIVANNGRIDRCPAAVSNGVGTPQGSSSCTWGRTSYGNEKASSFPNGTAGGAQSGLICPTGGPLVSGCPADPGLGAPVTRYITLLGQSPTETTHNGNDYVEGNGGNDVIYGEDGSDSIHGDTPAQDSPRLDECLATSDPQAGQDIIVGGYGNDTLCGDGGDDAILGNRGLVTVVPFSGSVKTIGTTSGGPYGTLNLPSSGNTIYQVRLDVESVNGVLTPIPNWNNPTASGQATQHDVIFGGQGNDTLHGSPGDDFIQGDDGMHVAGQPASTGGDDILFGGGGNDSIEGGPGNDQVFGGVGNDDQDVIRTDTAIAPKVDEAGNCLPMAFPTISKSPSLVGTSAGYCPLATWANVSYASRFPLVSGTYDSDPGALDNGGQTSRTNVFGDILYGGANRDISQSQGNPTGYGDRIVDANGAYNLEFVCPAAYGGSQIIRSLSPTMLTFIQQLALADGAYGVNQSKKAPTTLSSGDTEASIIYPGAANPDNAGSAYPTTAGHFTC